ncbi:methylated-DNA--[protein]-cysteine S-methyltransferase [Sphingosinicella rhizophila]|uniref:Methylated-DNA--[protein]-cysteine S-methyltransferase n=1 Tax=Sphingosinicella rhizophila TaxID=3050082 RepID=A0ABU3Q8C2_9SPHN|nr:methylated-DNA--[protein]-cysteine S-methyltransferase [Sphingosinicella sp. GR2756]MDT9599658.1 methylated-DNA--[protein]-cysteine S-methyltransferase [Sphingosinicella sp. GR2756]
MPGPVTETGFLLFSTAIGRCAILWRAGCIIGTALPERSETALHARLEARVPGAAAAHPPAFVQETVARIVRLLNGDEVDFEEIALDFGTSEPFERQVYVATRRIRCGAVRTYGEIAAQIGQPGAARAVGSALGRNPLPIIIPCHRVLAASGKSGGFSAPGGVATKFKLLEIERARRRDDPSLFADLPLAVKPH